MAWGLAFQHFSWDLPRSLPSHSLKGARSWRDSVVVNGSLGALTMAPGAFLRSEMYAERVECEPV